MAALRLRALAAATAGLRPRPAALVARRAPALRHWQACPPLAGGVRGFPTGPAAGSEEGTSPSKESAEKGSAPPEAEAAEKEAKPAAVTVEEEKLVLVQKIDTNIAVVTLNRPKHLNALSDGLMHQLVEKLRELDADDYVRAIVLEGGTTFAAGADIKEMHERPDYAAVRHCNMLAHWSAITSIRKPIIAAVDGFALGGGCELAMSCDIIIASEKAKFGQPEIKLGTIPGVGGTQRLLRAVGKSKAMEMILTGAFLSAEEAEKAGLVSRVTKQEEVLQEAKLLAKRIAEFSAPAVQLAKECVNAAAETTLAEGLRFERNLFHATWALEDRREGFAAFSEKRKPTWKHG